MGQAQSLVVTALGALLVLALYAAYTHIYVPLRLPLIAPGPPSAHWFYGNMRDGEPSELYGRLYAQFGHVYTHFGLANAPRLVVADTRAVAHILQHADVYRKPGVGRRMLTQLTGPGLLTAEGEPHRLQRKALNPAFGAAQIRELTGIFLDKANELRDVLAATVDTSAGAPLNIEGFFSRTTLDIIGLAGFGYDFGTLGSGPGANELASAFETIFNPGSAPGVLDMLALVLPGFPSLPTARNRHIAQAMNVMRRIGRGLIAKRKADAAREAAQGEKLTNSRARDLLSLLVRANTSADPKQRLSDEDVLAQIPTFLVAGHETTSTLLSWVLFALAQRPDIQASLREECRASPLPTGTKGNAPLDTDALADLDRLPLLDAVLRETLRRHAPVAVVMRAAARADELPLARPFQDRKGVERSSVPVRKGEMVTVPIRLVNHDPAIWGADADEWRPERWMDGSVGEKAKAIPGLWGSTLAFSGGSHSCIGYKFTLYEAKLMLHALICAFDVSLAVPAADIGMIAAITWRPYVKSRKAEGGQLPVLLRRVADD